MIDGLAKYVGHEMITYLEIIEQPSTIEEIPQTIRLKVADKAEAVEKLPAYEPLFEGMDYVKQIHYCNHDEKEKCVLEAL